MGDGKVPVYYCPYCTNVSYQGGPAKLNLTKHVKYKHPDKLKEFKKTPETELVTMENMRKIDVKLPGTRIVEPQPDVPIRQIEDAGQMQKMEQQLKEQEEKNRMLQQQMQQKPGTETTYIPPVAPLPSYVDELPPQQFLQKFLEHYKCKALFIMMMVDSINMTGNPPDTATLVQALKNMDSGHNKTPLQADFIGQMYDARLQKYWKRQQELKMTHNVSRSPDDPYGYGSYGQQPTYPSDRRYNQPSPLHRETYDSRVSRLEDELRRRDEQDKRNLEMKIQEFQTQLTAAKTGQVDPQVSEFQRQLKEQTEENRRIQQAQAEENKRLQQQMQEQKEQNLRNEINQIKNLAVSSLTPDQIQSMISQGISSERDRFTGTDLKQEMEERLRKIEHQAGTTQIDVELKKAELEHDIKKSEIEGEEAKARAWGDNLKDLVEVGGEAVGRGLSTMGSQPPQTPQAPQGPENIPPPTNQISCPSCNTPLQLQPGIGPDVSCGKCGAQFQVSPEGTTKLIGQRMMIKKEPAPESQAGFTVEQKIGDESKPYEPPITGREHPAREEPPPANEHRSVSMDGQIGICDTCGKPVLENNIGKTESKLGKVYCIDCA